MKILNMYHMKPYYISDNDILLLDAIAHKVAEHEEVGDYQSAAFSMLLSRLKARMVSMNKELKNGSF